MASSALWTPFSTIGIFVTDWNQGMSRQASEGSMKEEMALAAPCDRSTEESPD